LANSSSKALIMKLYRIAIQNDQSILQIEDAPKSQPQSGQVRIRIEAAALNYRDLIVRDGVRAGGYAGRVPLSDAAGIIDAVGPNVSRWKEGDRVTLGFFQNWIDGAYKPSYLASALGGANNDGVLAEYVIAPENAIIATPQHLTSVEAAAMPCAGVTAWHALIARGGITKDSIVLTQGTGGVALFGLQIAHAMGAQVIALSSSDEKLARVAALGATYGVNYKTHPEWDVEVMRLTQGAGASHILELGGAETFECSLKAAGPNAKIAQIGVLTGFDIHPSLARLPMLNADILGVMVGSLEHLFSLANFYARRQINPIIDSVVAFDEVETAYARMRAGAHFGKIVIDLR
jgi:NADPH:quinone reductase-like Zn-dependent oxidoreductase